MRRPAAFRPVPATPIYAGAMNPASELKRLAEAVRQAEAELDAATTRSALNAAAKRLMNACGALKRMQEKPAGATRRAPSRGGPGAGAS
jgi:hypothetical protein